MPFALVRKGQKLLGNVSFVFSVRECGACNLLSAGSINKESFGILCAVGMPIIYPSIQISFRIIFSQVILLRKKGQKLH